MKTITYTQLRNDLSATLELLRSGESITVTQRGKPDTVIMGKTLEPEVMERTSPATTLVTKAIISKLVTPEAMEGIGRLARQFDNYLHSDETRDAIEKLTQSTMKLHNVSDSFLKALEHTQSRHADIIKKLEDK